MRAGECVATLKAIQSALSGPLFCACGSILISGASYAVFTSVALDADVWCGWRRHALLTLDAEGLIRFVCLYVCVCLRMAGCWSIRMNE